MDAWLQGYFKVGVVGKIEVMRTPKDILVVCGQVSADIFYFMTYDVCVWRYS